MGECRHGEIESICYMCKVLKIEELEAQNYKYRQAMTGWKNSYGWKDGEHTLKYIDDIQEYFDSVLETP